VRKIFTYPRTFELGFPPSTYPYIPQESSYALVRISWYGLVLHFVHEPPAQTLTTDDFKMLQVTIFGTLENLRGKLNVIKSLDLPSPQEADRYVAERRCGSIRLRLILPDRPPVCQEAASWALKLAFCHAANPFVGLLFIGLQEYIEY
jgi:hypothetical protein